MKATLLSAGAVAAVVLGVVAQAATITETLTGTITGGIDTGLFGANDDAGLFGGGNLFGAMVTLRFSYDTALLNRAATNNTNGSGHFSSPGPSLLCPAPCTGDYEAYLDEANDGAVTVSTTIGAHTQIETNQLTSNVGPSECATFACSTAEVAYNNFPNVIPFFLISTGPGDFVFPEINNNVEVILHSTTSLPIGDLADSSATQRYFNSITDVTLQLENLNVLFPPNLPRIDNLIITPTANSASPEPTTWAFVAIGLGVLARMKRCRNANRRMI
jgi:hypothetical protein